MAIVNGKPGKYARTQADKRMVLSILAGMVSAFIVGVLTGFLMAWRHSLLWWAAGMAAMFAMYFIMPWWLNNTLTVLGRQRIRYLRGAQGEALVGWLLQGLTDDWHVFHGLQLRHRQDVDHIVVGPSGVWCLSTKSHRGLYSEQPDGRVFYNNKPTMMIGEASWFAQELKQRLGALLGADVPWVEAVLCVPMAYVEFQGPRNGVWVLHQENLTDTLEKGRKRLDKAGVKRVAKAVEMIAAQAKEVWREPRPESAEKAVPPVPRLG